MNKQFFIILLTITILTIVGLTGYILLATRLHAAIPDTQTVSVKPVSSEISADGSITAQNQATLHFQTAGKVIYLPVKEGDTVYAGQTIAQLDTYALQRNLQLAANAYQTAKNTNDQTQENQQAGVIEGQQRISLDTTNKNSYSNTPEAQIITDQVKRLVDTSQLSQNSAQLNVDLANYAIQLATLTSPLNGTVTHEDITTSNQNITPTTSFTVADPSTLVFRANIADTDIDYVSEGANVKIIMDGSQDIIQGTVAKIYPAKITLSNGQQGYQVDITGDTIKNMKMDQSGTVLIHSNIQADVMLVPAWTVIGNNYIWVQKNNKPVLKTITTGKTHGDMIEVTGGLSTEDKIITDPQAIPEREYQLL